MDPPYPESGGGTEPFPAIGGDTEEWDGDPDEHGDAGEAGGDEGQRIEGPGDPAAADEPAAVAPATADDGQEGTEPTGGVETTAAEDPADPARLAEIRAMDEILALESDLEQVRQEATAEIESLRERLAAAEQGAHAAAALEAGVDPAELRREVRERAEAEVREDLALRRAELESRLRAEIEAEVEDRIAKVRADADERIRTEVEIARSAAEDHFKEALGERELELELERSAKAKLVEDSEQRLAEIERKAAEAAARVAGTEARLAEKEANLREYAEERLDAERERIRAEAAGDAGRRAADLEAELERGRLEADRRVEELEGRLKLTEAAAAQQTEELRLAAAAWIRGQADRLRRQGIEGLPQETVDAQEERFRIAASRIDAAAARVDAAAERSAPEPEPTTGEEDIQAWDIGKGDEKST